MYIQMKGNKMSEQPKIVYQGPGVGFILFVVFLVLKLTSVIDWSWWWVTAPLWIPFAIFLGILGIVLVVALLIAIIKACTGGR